MWVALDKDDRRIATSVGSRIIDHFKQVASYSIVELLEARPDHEEAGDLEGGDLMEEAGILSNDERSFSTIADVMAWARAKVAEMAGVTTDAVKLDLKIEY